MGDFVSQERISSFQEMKIHCSSIISIFKVGRKTVHDVVQMRVYNNGTKGIDIFYHPANIIIYLIICVIKNFLIIKVVQGMGLNNFLDIVM
jgi:hypothetical protein